MSRLEKLKSENPAAYVAALEKHLADFLTLKIEDAFVPFIYESNPKYLNADGHFILNVTKFD